jgi:L-fuculose-phosphate aldolase
MYEKSLVIANDGNISWRISDQEILISPTGVCKADMTPDMILKVDMNGNLLEGEGRPSSEIKMHLKVYQVAPDRRAVVHAHPSYATAFAVANMPIDQLVYPTNYSFFGMVPVTVYGTSTTNELADSIEEFIREGKKGILLANHGALTSAANLWDAYFLMERLESYAKIYFLARQLGGGRPLTDDEAGRLEEKIARQKSDGRLY